MKRELHRGRIDVVRRLAEIDVVVRVNDIVLAALLAQYLEGAIGHHLVRVHVRRSSSAAVNHVDPEMLVVQPFPDLARGLRDRVDYVAVDELQIEVGARGCFLHGCERGDESWKLTQLDATDAEVLHRTQSLNPVQCIDGNVALAEEVSLAASGPGEIDARSISRLEAKLFQPEGKKRLHVAGSYTGRIPY